MTREEISKQIEKAIDYLGTLKVEGYKNAKILVTGLEFLDSLSKEVISDDSTQGKNVVKENSDDHTDK